MRRIVAHSKVLEHFARRAVNHSDAITRRIAVNPPVSIARNRMSPAYSQTRRRAVRPKHKNKIATFRFKRHPGAALKQGDVLAHWKCTSQRAHDRAIAA